MANSENAKRGFTGWHMFGSLAAFFGVVIAVNVLMATYATSTFGGLVVENSYIASQKYNSWLDEARNEAALGWKAQAHIQPDGRVALTFEGVPAGAVVKAEARHPLGRMPDRLLTFQPDGMHSFVSDEALPMGRWDLRLEVEGDGHRWREEIALQ
ncbi:MAG: FixH family protein [Sphingomonadales bacterium]|nr:FixH family protein [Sphingomonadales bacterium]MBD3774078.1 FixH family protein [Paracoccaceae bacterium]